MDRFFCVYPPVGCRHKKGLGGMLFRLLFSLLPFLMLTDGGGAADEDGGEPSDKPTDADPEPEDVSGLKSALEKERTKRKQYEGELKTARDAQKELEQLKADARKREEDEAREQGEYQRLYEGVKPQLETLQGEVKTKDERIEELLAIVTEDVDSQWDGLPEEVRDVYSGADDPLEKKKFLARDATKKLIERLTANATTKPGNGPNPKPADRKTTSDEDKRARAAIRPRF